MKHRYFAIAGLAVVAGVAAFWMTRAPTLSFKPATSPEGFRELILQTSSSRLDAGLFLTPQDTADATIRASLPEDLTLCDALFRDDASPTIGEPESDLTIVEFFDYRCPYCRVLSDILFDIQASQSGVRVIFKEWPILSQASKVAARAALAAAEQGRYEDFHRRMMGARLVPTLAYIENAAAGLGLDTRELLQSMRSEKITNALDRNAWSASEIGFLGTPSLIVGRTIVQGSITRPQLEELIRLELSAGSTSAC